MPEQAQEPRIITMGCRLNGYESAVMRQLSTDAGLGEAVIINSCAVTNEAVRQTRQAVRRARRENPAAKIIVTGCAAQIEPVQFAAMAEADAVIGNQEKLQSDHWATLARSLKAGETASGAPILSVNDIMTVREFAPHLIDGYGDRARAFVQVQTGCDHRCTFCIIPYGRGNSRSAPPQMVAEQACRLVEAGHRELVLTGVDITSYGADLPETPRLDGLIDAILKAAPDVARIRFSSIDVAEIDAPLFERLAYEPRVAPHVHLSLQSGDNMILKRMKRRHDREAAIEFCHRLRAARPEVAFGADLIAGFPTETDQMFDNSLKIVEEAGLQYLHVFPFSPRAGAPAARMPQLASGLVKARAAQLRAAGERAHEAFLNTLIGQTQPAIIESGGRGRLANFAEVQLPPTVQGRIGDLVMVGIAAREGTRLRGVIPADDVVRTE